MPKYRLISFELCPFVQRSVITLEEKGIAYEIEHIDLSNKPQWFLKISPFGKVPTLVVDDDTVLFESAVINEYLDETAGTPLNPEDPLVRAHDRAWLVFVTAAQSSLFGLTAAMTEQAARDKAKALSEQLDRLEAHFHGGPLWHGESFSLMDAASAPMLQRLRWVDRYVPELGLLSGRPKLRAWIDALLARPSVQRSTVEHIERKFIEMIGRDRGKPGLHSWVGERALPHAASTAA